jgi:hypothetical protein
VSPKTHDQQSIEYELDKYSKFDVFIEKSELKNKLGPFYFYSRHHDTFKKLFSMAKAILCIPATSVPSECLFSQAGLVQSEIRNRLSPALLKSIILIKENTR